MYGVAPPVTVTVISASLPPLQETGVDSEAVASSGSYIVRLSVTLHPLASVTSTE